jgi:hypothetical protein
VLLKFSSWLLAAAPPRRRWVFLLCFSLIFWRAFFIPVEGSVRGRSVARGDGFSDANILAAARYFFDEGFFSSYFQPIVSYAGKGSAKREGQVEAYLHYPPLPDILAGAFAKLMGTTEERVLRLLPIALSMVWFWVIYGFLRQILPRKEADWSATGIVLSNYFVAWADNLCYHMYSELLTWSLVFSLYLYLEKKKPFKSSAGIWGLYLVASLVSFDAILYFAVVVVGFGLIYRRTLFTREAFLLALAPLLALFLRAYQNALYLGSWSAAWADFSQALFYRTVGGEWEGAPIWGQIYRLPWVWLTRVERFFIFPGLAFLIFYYLAVRKFKKEGSRLYGLSLTLAAATAAWPLLVPQHSAAHTFTTRQLGILYGVVAWVGFLEYLKRVRQDALDHHRVACVFHGVFLLYCGALAFSQQVLELYLRYGLLYPHFGK